MEIKNSACPRKRAFLFSKEQNKACNSAVYHTDFKAAIDKTGKRNR
jgi:hypothetical protein